MFQIPKFSPHGKNIVFISLIVALAMSLFSNIFGVVVLSLSLFCIYFFRDPDRTTNTVDGAIISPADGVITFVGKVKIPEKFGVKGDAIKISIFLSVFDVHVNRLPVDGVIKKIIYSHGKFISATKYKESDQNESNTLIIEDSKGNTIITTQIAGLIARRIVCTASENEKGLAGDRFGLIKFGSRVNVYLPTNFRVLVSEGQRMVAGETIMGFRDNEAFEKLTKQLCTKADSEHAYDTVLPEENECL
jgi:phosphatidylserine decarboxylase